MAASEVAREAIWLAMLLEAMGSRRPGPVPLLCDNQGALHTIENPMLTHKTKHIRVRQHFVRECHLGGDVKYSYCPTDEMIADGFTKLLDKGKFSRFRAAIGMLL